MPTNGRQPHRSAVTTLACVCGLAVTSLAAGAQPNGAATVPLALPDVTVHPPLPQDFPLPGQYERTADVTTSSIGARLNQLVAHGASGATASLGIALDDGTIPPRLLAAYQRAADILSMRDPSCRLHWSVLAGIGRIESGHARGGALFSDGRTASPILGPRLDGSLAGTATIRDSTGGQFDGDAVWERAVGPMQFLPSTWLQYAQDGNGDGARDPHNVYDAALGSAVYLCAGARDLSEPSQLNQALFSYNPSLEYVRAVLAWADHYAGLGPRPGAERTVTHTLAASRGADGTGERKRDDEPAKQGTSKPPASSPSSGSPGKNPAGSDNGGETGAERKRAEDNAPKPDTETESGDSTGDWSAPSDDGDQSRDEPGVPDTTAPSEPGKPSEPAESPKPSEPAESPKPSEPAEPTEPADPGETDDPSCEQPADTENTGDDEGSGDEDRADEADGVGGAKDPVTEDDGSGRAGEGDAGEDDAAEGDAGAGDADNAEGDAGEGAEPDEGTCEQPDDGPEDDPA